MKNRNANHSAATATALYNSPRALLIASIALLVLGALTIAGGIAYMNGWIVTYHALTSGIVIPGFGGVEIDNGIDFFRCYGEC